MRLSLSEKAWWETGMHDLEVRARPVYQRVTLSYELRPTAKHILDQYRFQLDEFRQPSQSHMMEFMTRFPGLQFLTMIDPCLPELVNFTRDGDVVKRMWSNLLHTLPSLKGLEIRNLGGRKCGNGN